jgi:hypothetical protein
VTAENRLTADQLAALAPGDPVTIESAADFGRRRHAAGTVVRVGSPHGIVKVKTRHDATYQERYSLRDGIRVGGLPRAELIDPHSTEPADGQACLRIQRVDTLYREWARNRADVDRLQRLHAAITECLENSSARTR